MSVFRWVLLGILAALMVLGIIFFWGSMASAFCVYGLILIPMAVIRTIYVNKEGESDFSDN